MELTFVTCVVLGFTVLPLTLGQQTCQNSLDIALTATPANVILWPITWVPEAQINPELKFSVKMNGGDGVARILLAPDATSSPSKPYYVIQLGWNAPADRDAVGNVAYIYECKVGDLDALCDAADPSLVTQSTSQGVVNIDATSYTDLMITTTATGIHVSNPGNSPFITLSNVDPKRIRYVGIQSHTGATLGTTDRNSNWKFCTDDWQTLATVSGVSSNENDVIDGAIATSTTCPTVSQTGGLAYVMIDLQDEMDITGVTIYKNMGGTSANLATAGIFVGSCPTDGSGPTLAQIQQNVMCSGAVSNAEADNTDAIETPIFKPCFSNTYGKYIYIADTDGFTLCEVVIHGKPIAEGDKTKIGFASDMYSAMETPLLNMETVTLQRTGSANPFTCSSIDIMVSGGSATAADFTLGNAASSVIFDRDDQDTKDATNVIHIRPDCVNEGDRTIILGLTNPINAGIGSQATTTMTITDDDPIYNFQLASTSVAEDAGYIDIVVERGGITNVNSVINVETDKDCDASTPNTDMATHPVDYMPLTDSEVMFGNSGETTAMLRVLINNDNNEYVDETFCIRLKKGTPPAGDITTKPHSTIMVTIVNEDTIYEPCEASPVAVNEGGQYVAAICRRGRTDRAGCIDVYTQLVPGVDGAASNDYTEIQRMSVNFDVGDMTEDVTISTTADTDIEPTEKVKLVLALANTACSDVSPFIGQSELTIDIMDDDTTYSVTSLTNRIPESAEAVKVSFERGSSGREGVIMVSVYPSPSATEDAGTIFASEGSDYADAMGEGNHEVRFGIDALTAELTIPITGDPNIELDETFYVRIESADSTISEARRTTAVTIENDDAYYSIQQPVRTVSEKAEQFQVIVQRGPLVLDNGVTIAPYLQNAVTITMNTQTDIGQGAATPVSDFQAISNKELTFDQDESVKACPINVVNDEVVEGPEKFTVTISNPSVQFKPGADKAEITIEDDDGVISCSIGGEILVPIDEDSTDPVIVTCTRNGINNAAGSDQSLNRVARFVLTAIPESASQGQDFNAYSRTLEFAAGQATIMETINDLIKDDTVAESDETFRLEISSDDSELDSNSAITVTIRDNDVEGFGFAQTEYTVGESCDKLNVVIQRTGGPGDDDASTIIRVSATDGNNGATYPADYLTNEETVQFIGTQRQQVVTIAINPDNINEGSETFNLALSIVSGPGTINSGAATATVTIEDQTVTYSVQDTVINRDESSRTLPVFFVRSGDFCGSGEMYVSTMQGTARSSEDYIGFNNRLVSFPSTLNTASVDLTILDDNYEELPETLTVVIENTGNIVIGSGTTTVNIQDDDGRVFFRETAISADEGSGSASLTIARVGNSVNPTQVRIKTKVGGTATAGEDYTPVSIRFIEFGATESSKTFSLTITDDNIEEVDETFFVEITDTSDGVVGEPSEAVVTIVDDDKPSSEGGLSSTAIVGIVGGAVGAVLLIGGVIGAVLCIMAMRSGTGAAARAGAGAVAAGRAPPPSSYGYPSRYDYQPRGGYYY